MSAASDDIDAAVRAAIRPSMLVIRRYCRTAFYNAVDHYELITLVKNTRRELVTIAKSYADPCVELSVAVETFIDELRAMIALPVPWP